MRIAILMGIFTLVVSLGCFQRVVEAQTEAASYKAAYESAMKRINQLNKRGSRVGRKNSRR
jgi:outer membrane lipoprotein-sorting protein